MTYKGFKIIKLVGEGYYWVNGLRVGGGYFATIEECRIDIDDFCIDDTRHDPATFGPAS